MKVGFKESKDIAFCIQDFFGDETNEKAENDEKIGCTIEVGIQMQWQDVLRAIKEEEKINPSQAKKGTDNSKEIIEICKDAAAKMVGKIVKELLDLID